MGNNRLICLSGKAGAGKDFIGEYLERKHDLEVVKLAKGVKLFSAKITHSSIRDNYFNKNKVFKYSVSIEMIQFQIKLLLDMVYLKMEGKFKENFIMNLVCELTQTQLSKFLPGVNMSPLEYELIKNTVPINTKKLTLGQLQQIIGDGFRKWIDKSFWIKLLWKRIKDEKMVVITDCRYINEIEFFKSKGYAHSMVKRPYKLRKTFLCGRDEKHISETELDDYEKDNCRCSVIHNDEIFSEKELKNKNFVFDAVEDMLSWEYRFDIPPFVFKYIIVLSIIGVCVWVLFILGVL